MIFRILLEFPVGDTPSAYQAKTYQWITASVAGTHLPRQDMLERLVAQVYRDHPPIETTSLAIQWNNATSKACCVIGQEQYVVSLYQDANGSFDWIWDNLLKAPSPPAVLPTVKLAIHHVESKRSWISLQKKEQWREALKLSVAFCKKHPVLAIMLLLLPGGLVGLFGYYCFQCRPTQAEKIARVEVRTGMRAPATKEEWVLLCHDFLAQEDSPEARKLYEGFKFWTDFDKVFNDTMIQRWMNAALDQYIAKNAHLGTLSWVIALCKDLLLHFQDKKTIFDSPRNFDPCKLSYSIHPTRPWRARFLASLISWSGFLDDPSCDAGQLLASQIEKIERDGVVLIPYWRSSKWDTTGPRCMQLKKVAPLDGEAQFEISYLEDSSTSNAVEEMARVVTQKQLEEILMQTVLEQRFYFKSLCGDASLRLLEKWMQSPDLIYRANRLSRWLAHAQALTFAYKNVEPLTDSSFLVRESQRCKRIIKKCLPQLPDSQYPTLIEIAVATAPAIKSAFVSTQPLTSWANFENYLIRVPSRAQEKKINSYRNGMDRDSFFKGLGLLERCDWGSIDLANQLSEVSSWLLLELSRSPQSCCFLARIGFSRLPRGPWRFPASLESVLGTYLTQLSRALMQGDMPKDPERLLLLFFAFSHYTAWIEGLRSQEQVNMPCLGLVNTIIKDHEAKELVANQLILLTAADLAPLKKLSRQEQTRCIDHLLRFLLLKRRVPFPMQRIEQGLFWDPGFYISGDLRSHFEQIADYIEDVKATGNLRILAIHKLTSPQALTDLVSIEFLEECEALGALGFSAVFTDLVNRYSWLKSLVALSADMSAAAPIAAPRVFPSFTEVGLFCKERLATTSTPPFFPRIAKKMLLAAAAHPDRENPLLEAHARNVWKTYILEKSNRPFGNGILLPVDHLLFLMRLRSVTPYQTALSVLTYIAGNRHSYYSLKDDEVICYLWHLLHWQNGLRDLCATMPAAAVAMMKLLTQKFIDNEYREENVFFIQAVVASIMENIEEFDANPSLAQARAQRAYGRAELFTRERDSRENTVEGILFQGKAADLAPNINPAPAPYKKSSTHPVEPELVFCKEAYDGWNSCYAKWHEKLSDRDPPSSLSQRFFLMISELAWFRAAQKTQPELQEELDRKISLPLDFRIPVKIRGDYGAYIQALLNESISRASLRMAKLILPQTERPIERGDLLTVFHRGVVKGSPKHLPESILKDEHFVVIFGKKKWPALDYYKTTGRQEISQYHFSIDDQRFIIQCLDNDWECFWQENEDEDPKRHQWSKAHPFLHPLVSHYGLWVLGNDDHNTVLLMDNFVSGEYSRENKLRWDVASQSFFNEVNHPVFLTKASLSDALLALNGAISLIEVQKTGEGWLWLTPSPVKLAAVAEGLQVVAPEKYSNYRLEWSEVATSIWGKQSPHFLLSFANEHNDRFHLIFAKPMLNRLMLIEQDSTGRWQGKTAPFFYVAYQCYKAKELELVVAWLSRLPPPTVEDREDPLLTQILECLMEEKPTTGQQNLVLIKMLFALRRVLYPFNARLAPALQAAWIDQGAYAWQQVLKKVDAQFYDRVPNRFARLTDAEEEFAADLFQDHVFLQNLVDDSFRESVIQQLAGCIHPSVLEPFRVQKFSSHIKSSQKILAKLFKIDPSFPHELLVCHRTLHFDSSSQKKSFPITWCHPSSIAITVPPEEFGLDGWRQSEADDESIEVIYQGVSSPILVAILQGSGESISLDGSSYESFIVTRFLQRVSGLSPEVKASLATNDINRKTIERLVTLVQASEEQSLALKQERILQQAERLLAEDDASLEPLEKNRMLACKAGVRAEVENAKNMIKPVKIKSLNALKGALKENLGLVEKQKQEAFSRLKAAFIPLESLLGFPSIFEDGSPYQEAEAIRLLIDFMRRPSSEKVEAIKAKHICAHEERLTVIANYLIKATEWQQKRLALKELNCLIDLEHAGKALASSWSQIASIEERMARWQEWRHNQEESTQRFCQKIHDAQDFGRYGSRRAEGDYLIQNGQEHLPLLIGEWESQLIYTKTQKEIIARLRKDRHGMESLLMGKGKSTVLLPNVYKIYMDEGGGPIVIVPSGLVLEASRQISAHSELLLFSRATSSSIVNLRLLLRKIRIAKQERRPLVSTAESLASIYNKRSEHMQSLIGCYTSIQEMQQQGATVQKQKLERIQYEAQSIALKVGHLNELLEEFSLLIADEADAVLDPGREVCYSKGGLSFLPSHLLEVLFPLFEIFMGRPLFQDATRDLSLIPVWHPARRQTLIKSWAREALNCQQLWEPIDLSQYLADDDKEKIVAYLTEPTESLPSKLQAFLDVVNATTFGQENLRKIGHLRHFFAFLLPEALLHVPYKDFAFVPKSRLVVPAHQGVLRKELLFGDPTESLLHHLLLYAQSLPCKSACLPLIETCLQSVDYGRPWECFQNKYKDQQAEAVYQQLINPCAWQDRLFLLRYAIESFGDLAIYSAQYCCPVQRPIPASSCCGFSGTLDLQTLPLQNLQDPGLIQDRAFGAMALQTALQATEGLETAVLLFEDPLRQIEQLATRKEVSAIVNISYPILRSNREVATLLRQGGRDLLFLEEGRVMYWAAGEQEPLLFDRSAPINRSTLLCYFAPENTRGVDLPISPGKVAFLAAPNENVCAFAQAIFRARQIGRGHVPVLYMHKEVARCIRADIESRPLLWGELFREIALRSSAQQAKSNFKVAMANPALIRLHTLLSISNLLLVELQSNPVVIPSPLVSQFLRIAAQIEPLMERELAVDKASWRSAQQDSDATQAVISAYKQTEAWFATIKQPNESPEIRAVIASWESRFSAYYQEFISHQDWVKNALPSKVPTGGEENKITVETQIEEEIENQIEAEIETQVMVETSVEHERTESLCPLSAVDNISPLISWKWFINPMSKKSMGDRVWTLTQLLGHTVYCSDAKELRGVAISYLLLCANRDLTQIYYWEITDHERAALLNSRNHDPDYPQVAKNKITILLPVMSQDPVRLMGDAVDILSGSDDLSCCQRLHDIGKTSIELALVRYLHDEICTANDVSIPVLLSLLKNEKELKKIRDYDVFHFEAFKARFMDVL